GAQPRVFPDDDRLGDERHAPPAVIVRSRAEIAVLADVGPPPEGNGGQVVDGDVRADHGPRGEGQLLRKDDRRGREHNDPAGLGNVGAEEPQQPGAQTVPWTRAPAEQGRLDDGPAHPQRDLPGGVRGSAALAQVGVFLRHGRIMRGFRPRHPPKARGPPRLCARPPGSRSAGPASPAGGRRKSARSLSASAAAWSKTRQVWPSATRSPKQPSLDTTAAQREAMASATATPNVSPFSARLG